MLTDFSWADTIYVDQQSNANNKFNRYSAPTVLATRIIRKEDRAKKN